MLLLIFILYKQVLFEVNDIFPLSMIKYYAIRKKVNSTEGNMRLRIVASYYLRKVRLSIMFIPQQTYPTFDKTIIYSVLKST